MQHKKQEVIDSIERFADHFVNREGIAPSTKEIAEGIGVSAATVSRYLRYMRDNGRIDYLGYRKLRTRKMQEAEEEVKRIPILGAVACGLPRYAEENIEDYISLPVKLLGKGSFYLLRASGESMTGAGIGDGDLVLVRRQDTAEPGQIVVALVEDEVTLKRYYPEPEKARVRLHPENPCMEDFFVDSCVIQGVAEKILKDLR